jgi:hypothetical protein
VLAVGPLADLLKLTYCSSLEVLLRDAMVDCCSDRDQPLAPLGAAHAGTSLAPPSMHRALAYYRAMLDCKGGVPCACCSSHLIRVHRASCGCKRTS